MSYFPFQCGSKVNQHWSCCGGAWGIKFQVLGGLICALPSYSFSKDLLECWNFASISLLYENTLYFSDSVESPYAAILQKCTLASCLQTIFEEWVQLYIFVAVIYRNEKKEIVTCIQNEMKNTHM